MRNAQRPAFVDRLHARRKQEHYRKEQQGAMHVQTIHFIPGVGAECTLADGKTVVTSSDMVTWRMRQ
jgi:hypothetical protein